MSRIRRPRPVSLHPGSMNVFVRAGIVAISCLLLTLATACGGSSHSTSTTTPAAAETIGITLASGSTQIAAGGKPFAAPLVATVTTNGIKTPGETVTFTAPTSGPSGTFANGTTTETDVTDSKGNATSSLFTANSQPGVFTVMATVNGVMTPVTYSLTTIGTVSYTFYLSGTDAASSFYAVAGVVVIDPTTGNVLSGEQDYNDGANGIASPQPKGDTITGGSLTFPAGSPPGQAILTLQTNNLAINANPNLLTPAPGLETFGVQFVNVNHALIINFDGYYAASGTMDYQSTTATPSGNYAFTMSGADSSNGGALDLGGVLSIAGTAINGTIDANDSGLSAAVLGAAIKNGTITAPDAYGRGTITGISNVTSPGLPITVRYYVVGPSGATGSSTTGPGAIRLIDVDSNPNGTHLDSAVGSAFSQGAGAGTFDNTSLGVSGTGASVFELAGNVGGDFIQFAAIGQFTTSNTSSSPANFSGVADDNEPNNFGANGPINIRKQKFTNQTYDIQPNGYGNLTFKVNLNTLQGLGDISVLGLYMTDPALNLEDPNNPVGGGGALLADMDASNSLVPTSNTLAGGTGVIIPQTDTNPANFLDTTGTNMTSYAVGWQDFFNSSSEFDMIAQGTTAFGVLNLTGLISDPSVQALPDVEIDSLGNITNTTSGDFFIGFPLPDPTYTGRYALTTGPDAIAITVNGLQAAEKFDMVIYQASGSQLFWLNSFSGPTSPLTNIFSSVAVGPIEQQDSSLSNLPLVRKHAGKLKK